MAILLTLHLLAAVIWVGGMFFAFMCLRPVAKDVLPPPLRLPLWQRVFQRFFRWVWLAIAALLVSGHGMIGIYGGMAAVGSHVHVMMTIAYVMVLLFSYLYFRLFKQLTSAVDNQEWPEGAVTLDNIRKIVQTNLILGLVVIASAGLGRFGGI